MFYSEACAVIHEIMGYLHKDGVIDEKAMREFDNLCLASSSLPPNSAYGDLPVAKALPAAFWPTGHSSI